MLASRLIAFVILVAAIGWIGSGMLGRQDERADAAVAPAQEAEHAEPRFQVATMEAQAGDHARTIVLSGRTEADSRASAVARGNGIIVDLKVARGQQVEKGAVLAVLSDEAREAQVAEAKARLEQRRTELKAKLRLIERGISPSLDKPQLEADIRAAEAALAQAEAEQRRGTVTAPIAGTVSSVPVSTGQALQAGATVAEVIALDPMLAVAEVAERQLAGIEVGDEATVRLVTGQTVPGRVRFISPTASAETRTYRVDVEVPNRDGAIPDGITAEVELKLAPVNSVRVPRSALTFSAEGRLSIRTVDADGRVSSVPVAIVEDARDTVWVAGPQDGSRIVVQGQDFVKDGQVVDVVQQPAANLLSRN
ncbi:efflux RND transporter periplasmic adaptor subunit [Propylenella binzhouense]|uniref:Efflux RND transporter periplasmic adaptor subunit n=1 Tax=Propylenella binzhouense TaxID=2555902 RepID=A0A964WVJ6_9HYPH|nr:efflux RND transporter periplasmic adaptor subunit [Propylenella binzhouense]MYZ50119.1 efflux RND transporter periplasmic adaptor subunit [Propylenella binzhouense]